MNLREGINNTIDILVTEKGVPFTGDVSFGIYDGEGEVIFHKDYYSENGLITVKLPPMHQNDYVFSLETDNGYTDPKEVNVMKSLKGSDQKRKMKVDIDQERDTEISNTEELLNAFYVENGNRIKSLETSVVDVETRSSIMKKDILQKIKTVDDKINKTDTKINTTEFNLSQRIGKEIDGVGNQIQEVVNDTNLSIEILSKKIDKSSTENGLFISQKIEEVKKSIPKDKILQYVVDDSKIDDNTLWTSEKISKEVRQMKKKVKDVADYGGGGASYFNQLLDVPESYLGQAGKSVVVNATEDGVEFGETSGGGASSYEVIQNTHGFIDLDWLYFDESDDTFKKAQANDEATLGAWHVVEVVDANTFKVAKDGVHEITNTLDLGEYVLSQDTAGGYTQTLPGDLGDYVLWGMEVVSSTHVSFYTVPAIPVGDTGEGVQSVVAGTGITVDNTDPLNPIINATGGGSGTVTSVAISGSDGLEVDSGSPVTTTGTIALGINKTAMLSHLNVEDGADVTDATNVAAAGAFMKATDDTDDIVVGTTNKFATAAEKTKLGFITVTQSVDLDQMESDIANKQPLDSDLTTIAGLTATTDNFLQAKAGAWASRTVAQVKTDLGLIGTNSGDQDLSGLVPYTGATADLNLGTYDVITDTTRASTSAGLLMESANGTDIGLLGAGNTANIAWYGNHNYSTATQDTIAIFTGAGKTLGSAALATYPSLTELAYVKGVTSAIQTQLNDKITASSADTLTNKTLTAPKFADLGFIADANGNELIIMDTVASAVNEITMSNAATGGRPTIAATGDDTNIDINVTPKGSGLFRVNGVNVLNQTNQVTGITQKTFTAPRITTASHIADANGNELIAFPSAVASAVNEITISNAATGTGPTVSVTGGDTNIDLNLQTKGTGVYKFNATSSQQSEIRLFEDTDNGSNYVAIKPPATLAADYTLTLPTDDGTSGQYLKTDGSGVLSWDTPAGGSTLGLWYSLTGSYASTSTFTFSGDAGDAEAIERSLFTCLSSADARKIGYIKTASHSAGTVTVTVVTDIDLASGDKTFKVAINRKIEDYQHLFTIPGEQVADASNPQGMFYRSLIDTYLLPVNSFVRTAAAGSGAACAWNVYKGTTNLFTSAQDMTTSATFDEKRPNTNTISAGDIITLRVTSSAGATNKASDLQVQAFIVPQTLYTTAD